MRILLLTILLVGAPLMAAETEPEPPARDTNETTCPDRSAELSSREDALREVRAERGRQTVELHKQQAHVARLEEQLQSQQRLLEDAIHEVVRARAKQRSVESRAEAASEIAEAEIALKRVDGSERNELEIDQARQLLQQASAEFDSGNFGGALYLATQSKGRIRRAATRVDAAEETGSVEGETAFTAPVALAVAKWSNDKCSPDCAAADLREGPGTDFPLLRRVETGTALIGYASKGAWVRVKIDDGTVGWIHESLVQGG